MDTLLKISGLDGGYHRETIIKDFSFEVKRGDFIGIIGPNGSGKTTLLRLLTKILRPEKGQIYLEGKDVTRMDLKQFCTKVAFVAQDAAISFPFSVFEIVLMGRIPHLKRLQFETKKDMQITKNALSMTDTVHLEQKMIDEISAGERQRVIIAKALAQEPLLLFLDEPTSHLDIGHQIQILDLLKKLNREQHLTIIMVGHDLNLVSEYCNRIILLDKGRIFKQGEPREVLTYQNIEAVYKTIVVVNTSSISHKPFVMLVSKEENK